MKHLLGCYVILHPNSITNDSTEFRVVLAWDWLAYTNRQTANLPIESSHKTYAEADKRKNELNGALKAPATT